MNRATRHALAASMLIGTALASASASARGTDTLAGMTFQVPDGWVPNGTGAGPNKSYGKSWREHGRDGRATIIVARFGTGSLSDRDFAAASAAVPELARLSPFSSGAGVTADGYRIRWQERCCGSRDGVRLGSTVVAVDNGQLAAVLMMITANLGEESAKAARDEFDLLVRSLRPTQADRGFRLEPLAGGGGLDGAYTHLTTGLTPNVFGGMNFTVENRIRLFDPAGIFSTTLPAEPGGVAEHCAATPSDCGTYRLLPEMAGAMQIELRHVEARWGAISVSTAGFGRSGTNLMIDGAEWHRVSPFPAGTVLAGTWRNTFAQGGSTAFASNSVSSEHALTLTSDGHYALSGYTGFSGTSEVGGGRTGVTVGGPQRAQAGRYAIEGYRIIFTAEDGSSHASSLFEPDGSDGLLVLGGANYLKVR